MHDQKEKSGTGKRKRFISPSGDLSLYLRERTCGFRSTEAKGGWTKGMFLDIIVGIRHEVLKEEDS
jgi:hypothetical protein